MGCNPTKNSEVKIQNGKEHKDKENSKNRIEYNSKGVSVDFAKQEKNNNNNQDNGLIEDQKKRLHIFQDNGINSYNITPKHNNQNKIIVLQGEIDDPSNTNNNNTIKMKKSEIKIDLIHQEKNNESPFIKYKELHLLGEGDFGKVYKVMHRDTKVVRAMKVIPKKEDISEEEQEAISKEFNILKTLNHPNILKVHEYYNLRNKVVFITDYLEGGSLARKLQDSSVMKEKSCSYMMKQILSAVSFCHLNKFAHKDLKLENILIEKIEDKENDYYKIVVIDFGNSEKITDGKFLAYLGNPSFMSPEAFDGVYDEKGDIWSCGVIAYTMLCGELPFEGSNIKQIMTNVNKGLDRNHSNKRWSKLSSNCKDFICGLLEVNVEHRMTSKEAIQTKFIKQLKKKLPKVLNNGSLNMIADRMGNFKADKVMQQASLNFITHNLIKKEDTEDLRKMFFELNTTNDGRLTKQQLLTGFKMIMKNDEAHKLVSQIMTKVDSDGNGFIEFEEFVCACLDKHKLLTNHNIHSAFNVFDTNNFGKIRINNIRNLLCSKQVEENAIQEIIDEIDENGDGEISFEEFKNMMEEIVLN